MESSGHYSTFYSNRFNPQFGAEKLWSPGSLFADYNDSKGPLFTDSKLKACDDDYQSLVDILNNGRPINHRDYMSTPKNPLDSYMKSVNWSDFSTDVITKDLCKQFSDATISQKSSDNTLSHSLLNRNSGKASKSMWQPNPIKYSSLDSFYPFRFKLASSIGKKNMSKHYDDGCDYSNASSFQSTSASDIGFDISNLNHIFEVPNKKKRPASKIQNISKAPSHKTKNFRSNNKKKTKPENAVVSLREHEFDHAVEYLKETLLSLYRDQIPPIYFNVRGRFIEFNTKSIPAEHIMDICKRKPDIFTVKSSKSLNETYIYLVEVPSWFEKWVDRNDLNDIYPQELWDQFEKLLKDTMNDRETSCFPGSIYAMSRVLQKLELPFLANMSLGTICHIVQLAIRVRKLLVYDLKTLKPVVDKTSTESQSDATTVEESI